VRQTINSLRNDLVKIENQLRSLKKLEQISAKLIYKALAHNRNIEKFNPQAEKLKPQEPWDASFEG